MIPTFLFFNILLPTYNFKKETSRILTNIIDSNINFSLNNIFSTLISPITIFMAIYLLLTIIIIIKITLPWEGPLQQKN